MSVSSSLKPETAKPKSPRRWFRFSLATLFLLLTIVCVCLGVVVNRAHRQQRAAAMIERAGGFVLYSHDCDENGHFRLTATPPGPAWLRDRLGIEYFDDIVSVGTHSGMNDRLITDQDFAYLRNLSKLRYISIPNGRITDAGCAQFDTLPALEEIDLRNTLISDAGLAHFKHCRQLQLLALDGSHITSDGLSSLNSHANLIHLSIRNTQIDDTGTEHLGKLPNLRTLALSGTKVTDQGLASLALLPLVWLRLDNTHVTGTGLAHFREHATLEQLDLDGTYVGDDGIAHLAKIPGLKTLWIQSRYISEKCFADLVRCKGLKELVIGESQFSPEFVNQIRQAMPTCKIINY